MIKDIVSNIRKSIFCHEYTDVGKKRAAIILNSWVNQCFDTQEDLIGFYQVPNFHTIQCIGTCH